MRSNELAGAALVAVLLLSVLAACSTPAAAYPGFYYHITSQTDELWISQDGSIWLEKTFTFFVETYSQYTGTEIWVGIPFEAYCQYVEDENGHEIEWWYVNGGNGVAIGEGDFEIPQGTGQTFTMFFDVQEFLHRDTDNESYVVMEYMPGWWGDDDTDSGTVDIAMIKVHLPENIPFNEVMTFEGIDFDWYNESNGTAVWNFYDVPPQEQIGIGIGFPENYVEPSYELNTYTTYDTDFDMDIFDSFIEFFELIFGGFIFILIFGTILFGIGKAFRSSYKSPVLKMEGVGVNYKLDAVEAATLLKRPPTTALTMVLFGMLRSGNIRVLSNSPLKLEVISKQGLSTYERGFITSIKKNGTLDQDKLKKAYRALVTRVVERTRAYNRKKTQDYYEKKVADAWKIITTVETPQVRLDSYDENLLWLMVDEKFKEKSNDTFVGDMGRTTVTYPTWYNHMPPEVTTLASTTTTAPVITTAPATGIPTPSGAKPPLPTSITTTQPTGGGPLGTIQGFAQSVSEGVSSTAEVIVSNVQSFAQTFTETFTKPAKYAPRRTSSSSSSSSSRPSCACACACVSCACACACAGGGGCT